MSKAYKIAFYITAIIIFFGIVIFLGERTGFIGEISIGNFERRTGEKFTSKDYSEIIDELKKRYGEDKRFRIIEVIRAEVDRRDHRPVDCPGGIRTADWQGKYFDDAILRISIDHDNTNVTKEWFDITNNICVIRGGYADRFVNELVYEHKFVGTIVWAGPFIRQSLGIEPNKDEAIRKKTNQVGVNGRINVKYEEGMQVTVFYNGKVHTDAWPAWIDEVDIIINQ